MAWTLVASLGKGSTDTGNNLTSAAIDTTGANLILISYSYYGNPATVSDNKGNTWTKDSDSGGAGSFGSAIYRCYGPTVGAGHTFSITQTTGQSYPRIDVQAWSGSAASPFDQQNHSNTVSPGSVTPTASGELVVAAAAAGGAGTMTIGSGMTITTQDINRGGNSVQGGIAYLVQTGAAAVSPTWANTGGGTSSSIATYQVSGGGGAAAVQYRSLLGVGV